MKRILYQVYLRNALVNWFAAVQRPGTMMGNDVILYIPYIK